MSVLTCEKCQEEFVHTKRGRKPKVCPKCRFLVNDLVKEHKVETKKTYICSICKKTKEKIGRGKLPKTCPECKNKAAKTTTKKEKEFICVVCEKPFIHKKSGRPKTCSSCKEKIANKPKERKIRQFTCNVCGKTYNHDKRGILPKTCKGCKESKKTTPKIKPEKKERYIEKTLYEVVSKKDGSHLLETVFSNRTRAESIASLMGFDEDFEIKGFIAKRKLKDAED